jgi:hypothetical protein
MANGERPGFCAKWVFKKNLFVICGRAPEFKTKIFWKLALGEFERGAVGVPKFKREILMRVTGAGVMG